MAYLLIANSIHYNLRMCKQIKTDKISRDSLNKKQEIYGTRTNDLKALISYYIFLLLTSFEDTSTNEKKKIPLSYTQFLL